MTKFHYKLSQDQKDHIAQNLIDILQKDLPISNDTRTFVGNWILTGPSEKKKAFYDVWDIVLKNYLPATRPILFRSCRRITKKVKIASFTSSIDCASRFSEGKGYLLVCDTDQLLMLQEALYKPGEYRNSFYPLVNVLKKAKKAEGWGFSEYLLNYIGESEYIMRTSPGNMYNVKWVN